MENDNLIIKCADLKDNDKIPVKYTGYGEDISPEFIIENLSPEAESYIITLEDLNHPIKNFTHWIIWNIPATTIIPANIPGGDAELTYVNECEEISNEDEKNCCRCAGCRNDCCRACRMQR